MAYKVILSTSDFLRFMLVLKAIFKDHKRKDTHTMEFRINNVGMLRSINNQLKKTFSWRISPHGP